MELEKKSITTIKIEELEVDKIERVSIPYIRYKFYREFVVHRKIKVDSKEIEIPIPEEEEIYLKTPDWSEMDFRFPFVIGSNELHELFIEELKEIGSITIDDEGVITNDDPLPIYYFLQIQYLIIKHDEEFDLLNVPLKFLSQDTFLQLDYLKMKVNEDTLKSITHFLKDFELIEYQGLDYDSLEPIKEIDENDYRLIETENSKGLRNTYKTFYYHLPLYHKVLVKVIFYITKSFTLGLIFVNRIIPDKEFLKIIHSLKLEENLIESTDLSKFRNFERIYQNKEFSELIGLGESKYLEFKERYDIQNPKHKRKILSTLVGFMNTDGGRLIIGVDDDGLVKGINVGQNLSLDSFQRHFDDLIISKIVPSPLHLYENKVQKVDGKEVLILECRKSDTPTYLKFDSDIEEFYIRNSRGNLKLNSSESDVYKKRRFR